MTRSTIKLPPRGSTNPPARPPTSRARRAQHGRAPLVPPAAGARRTDLSPIETAQVPAAPVVAKAVIDAAQAVVHEHPRLSKRMSELGLCSRREADEWIENGWVKVDGAVMTTLGTRVAPQASIEIDGAARKHQSEQVTILLNKPIGYVSGQAEDGYQPRTLGGPKTARRSSSSPATSADLRRRAGSTSIPPALSCSRRTAASRAG